jgi:hypothetical protein
MDFERPIQFKRNAPQGIFDRAVRKTHARVCISKDVKLSVLATLRLGVQKKKYL